MKKFLLHQQHREKQKTVKNNAQMNELKGRKTANDRSKSIVI